MRLSGAVYPDCGIFFTKAGYTPDTGIWWNFFWIVKSSKGGIEVWQRIG